MRRSQQILAITTFRHSAARFASTLALASLLAGCVPTPAETVPVEKVPAPSSAGSVDTSPASVPDSETWDSLHVKDAQVGYVRTSVRNLQEGGQKLLEIEAEQRLKVGRFGDVSQPGIIIKSIESASGNVVRFESRQELGAVPETATGRVVDGKMLIETKSTGKTVTSEIPWTPDLAGFFAIERSLVRQPMRPGERRTLRGLAPMFNQLVAFELNAKEQEDTPMAGGVKKRLLHIDAVTVLPDGSRLHSSLWADDKGDALKTQTAELGQTTFRTTKEIALTGGAGGSFDLGLETIVKLSRPLKAPHKAQRIRYKVSLATGTGEGQESDPARVFPAGPTQEVRPLDDHTAEITVRSLRPGAAGNEPPAAEKPPTDADRQPNNLVQSDDPRVVQMANEAARGETDPVKVALALEKHVGQSIRKVNFTQALATAADVANTREGDCTEHAVLLAAVARAKGIPARVAIGLVYVEGLQGFGYHMWNEFYLNDRWVPMDATLGQGGIGAGHLKLSHSSLAGGDAYSSFLPVARVLGRLNIEVMESP